MPVSLILCEGGTNSPDVRILRKLLGGICQVKPMGGKYGMGDRILARRETLGANAVFGVLDGDFLLEWKGVQNLPVQWTKKINNEIIHFGWRWERKEIENYLVDLDIVCKTLPNGLIEEKKYRKALEKTRDKISAYQAARTALNACRRRFKPLESSFGVPCGRKEKHSFPIKLDEKSCIEGIKQNIDAYENSQIVTYKEAENLYSKYLPECKSGGKRYDDYLYCFAGKDLLWGMNEWLENNLDDDAWAFREKVLKGIEKSTEDVSGWTPSWKNLLEEIKMFR